MHFETCRNDTSQVSNPIFSERECFRLGMLDATNNNNNNRPPKNGAFLCVLFQFSIALTCRGLAPPTVLEVEVDGLLCRTPCEYPWSPIDLINHQLAQRDRIYLLTERQILRDLVWHQYNLASRNTRNLHDLPVLSYASRNDISFWVSLELLYFPEFSLEI